nr:hypothetical protein [uncultured Flavobacterium sp.]
MTKEEKIKEAYGEYYETVKNYIDDNGWCVLNVSQKEPINFFAHHGKTEWKPIKERVCWRPKSLQGIEDNNSWIKVESEADLPKESYNYWIFQNDGLIQSMKEYELNKKYYNIEATHYQPIEKPKPPLY